MSLLLPETYRLIKKKNKLILESEEPRLNYLLLKGSSVLMGKGEIFDYLKI